MADFLSWMRARAGVGARLPEVGLEEEPRGMLLLVEFEFELEEDVIEDFMRAKTALALSVTRGWSAALPLVPLPPAAAVVLDMGLDPVLGIGYCLRVLHAWLS